MEISNSAILKIITMNESVLCWLWLFLRFIDTVDFVSSDTNTHTN